MSLTALLRVQRVTVKFVVTTAAAIGTSLVILGLFNQDYGPISPVYRSEQLQPSEKSQLQSTTTTIVRSMSAANKTDAKLVLILAYQRTGSTFLGEMFDSNFDVFYMFEPLDSLYTALYGTRPGWNIPSDIATYRNGTARTVSKQEILAVSSFLAKLFNCDVDSWPTETLAHTFWTQFPNAVSDDYSRCLSKHNFTITRCSGITDTFCGGPDGRFGQQPPDRLALCNRMLWNDTHRNSVKSTEIGRRFVEYKRCTNKLRTQVVKKCVPLLAKACRSRTLRTIKTVRTTMDSVELMLSSMPNLRVIHLIRDPRAVAVSRSRFDASARSTYSNELRDPDEIMNSEVSIYCRTAVNDILKRRQLELLYPDRIYTAFYDEMIKDIRKMTKNVYLFIKEWRVHPWTQGWLDRNVKTNNKSVEIAEKWRHSLTASQYIEITKICSKMLSML